MVEIITGGRDTLNINQARRVVDMSKTIALLNPSANPLTLLSQKAARLKAINPEFSWLEDDLRPAWDAINNGAGYTDSDTDLVVDNAAYFEIGSLVDVPRTGEIMKVTAINTSTNTITVARSVGSTAAAALVDDDPLMIMSDANQEGAKSRASKTTKIESLTNYTQIFRTPVEATRTESSSELYGGKDRNYYRRKAGIEHAKKIECALWFGEKGIDTSGDHPERYTGGVFEFLAGNFTDAGGTLTEADFEAFVRDAFKYGSDVKYGFASPLVLSVINLWGVSKLQTVPRDKTYGLAVTKYISAHGELNLIKNRLFEGAVYGGYMVVLDFADECVAYRYLQGGDTKLKTNIQDNDADGWKDEYLTEAGLQLKQPDRHAVLTGVTG